MKPFLFSVTLLAALAACARPEISARAVRFSKSTASVGTALLPRIAPRAEADHANARRAALARGMQLQEPHPDCAAFFTFEPGTHFSDCPVELPIAGFTAAPTEAAEIYALLQTYLAFGEAVGALASSTAPKDTATAEAAFAKNAAALAKELEAEKLIAATGKLNAKIAPLQEATTLLLDRQKTASICNAMEKAEVPFFEANRTLAVYVGRRIDLSVISQLARFRAATRARDGIAADQGYARWRAAFLQSLLAPLDASSTDFNAVLDSCHRKTRK